MPSNSGAPLLSICLTGRNDSYGGPFVRRLSLALNLLTRNAAALGRLDALECVVTDWNAETPLANAVSLIPEAAKRTRFVVVPPEVASRHNSSGTAFHSTKSANVAFRRSHGTYILYMPADILFPCSSLRNLFTLLEQRRIDSFSLERSCMIIPRSLLPEAFDETEWPLADLDGLLTCAMPRLKADRIRNGICANAGAILVHRDLMFSLGGFREDMGGWGGSDIDFGIRAGRRGPVVDLDGFGVRVVDFPRARTHQTYKQRIHNQREADSFAPQSDEWGLAAETFAHQTAHAAASSAKPAEPSLRGSEESVAACLANRKQWIEALDQNLRGRPPLAFRAESTPLLWVAGRRPIRRALVCVTARDGLCRLLSDRHPLAELVLLVPDTAQGRRLLCYDNARTMAKSFGIEQHAGLVRMRCGSLFDEGRFDPEMIDPHDQYDLILHRPEAGMKAGGTISVLLDRLNPGGALLLADWSPRSIASAVADLEAGKYRCCVFLCQRYGTALILRDDALSETLVVQSEEAFVCAWAPAPRTWQRRYRGLRNMLQVMYDALRNGLSAILR